LDSKLNFEELMPVSLENTNNGNTKKPRSVAVFWWKQKIDENKKEDFMSPL